MAESTGAGPRVSVVQPRQLAERLERGEACLLLDVRERDEHAYAAIRGAKLIPLGELEARLEEISGWKGRDVVVYCHHGMRSLRAAGMLVRAGFEEVWNLSGGIDQWSLEVDDSVKRY